MGHIPDWLRSFANDAAQLIIPLEPLAPVGCHFTYSGGRWEVTLFPLATRIEGGPRHGELVGSRYNLDLASLQLMFSSIRRCDWQSASMNDDDELGCHVAIHGSFDNHNVALRILAEAPSRFEPGRIAKVDADCFEELV
jgi:hypothetical protein